MKKALLQIFSLALLVVPAVSFAQSSSNWFNLNGFEGVISRIIGFINSVLIPSIFAIAFLVFVWGVFKAFILGGHDSEKRDEGKQLVIWSIIGFVVMLSVWGIVNLVASSLGFQGERLDGNAIPTFNLPNGSSN